MLIQPALTSFPWVTTRGGWGTDPLWPHSCPGGPAAQKRTRIVTSGSSQVGWASQTSFCRRKDPQRAMLLPSGVFGSVLGPPIPANSLWATSTPWLCGSREKRGTRVTVLSLYCHRWSLAPVSLLMPASLPLAPTTHTANGAALLAQGPTQSQHSTNGPSWSDSSPHPPLSSSPGTRWNRHPGCPREPGRGSPGEEQGQGGGNTVLLGKGRAQPWVNRSRPGLPGWPFTQQVGPPLLQAQALTSKLTRLGPPASAPYLTIGRADKGLNKPSLQRSVRRPGRPILNPREETKE